MTSLRVSVVLIAVSLLATIAGAQQRSGSISGRVTDTTNAVLQGARVLLEPADRSAVSDAQGQFAMYGVAPGKYTLSVSYIGFESFSKEIEVSAGAAVNIDAALKVSAKTEVITVRPERERGEEAAINIERTADNIVQVLPSKVITSLPNTNIADAAGRLPSVSLERDEGEGKYIQIRGTEPRLSSTTINGVELPSPEGDVRNIKLDVVPSALVDRIEVNKTLSANQDADAIGGSVDLITKTPSNDLNWDVEGLGGYTHIIGGRWLDSFNGTVDSRFGPGKKWGFLFGSSYDWNGRGINDLEPSPGTMNITNPDGSTGRAVPVYFGEDLRTYKYYRTRYGFTPELDYEIRPGSSIYLRGLYSDFHDFGETWVYSPNTGNTLQSVNGSQETFYTPANCPATLAGSCTAGFMQYRQYVRRPDQQIFSGQIGGSHDFSTSLFKWEFSTSRSHNIGGQDFATTRFNNTTGGPANANFGLDLSNPYEPKFPVLNSVNIFDPTQYFVSEKLIPHYHSTQLNLQGSASFQKHYSIASHYGAFEIGFKARNGHKTQNENDQFFDPINANDPRFAMSNFIGSFQNPSYYDHAYANGPLTDYNKINQALLPLLSSGFALDTQKSILNSLPSDYAGDERVTAGYAMNTLGLGKFSLQTGVRVEATNESYTANQINLNNGTFVSAVPVNGGGDYTRVLPSVQLQYHVQENTNLRAAFGMGLARPNFSDLVPARQIDPNTPPFPSVNQGNPNLKATLGHNYDLLAEHYFKPFGILQGGFFYKELSDPIYNTTQLLVGSPFSAGQKFFLQQSINGPKAHISGFETAWEQRLSFLPGLLSGFGVSANYSYTSSRANLPDRFGACSDPTCIGRTDRPALQRTAPNNWNLGFTYDKARLSARFAVSHNDASIFSYFYTTVNGVSEFDPVLGLHGPNGDQYLYAHTQYDVQGSYRVAKGLSVVAYGLNLTNEVFGFYQGSKVFPIQREFYHPTAALGLRWTSARE